MKIKKWIILGVVFFTFGIAIPAGAWVFVPPLGDTGWQTFERYFEAEFSGIAGFVVSNQGDDLADSWLLIDNLSHAGDSNNKGFELGSYDGYTLIEPIYDNGDLVNFGVVTSFLWYQPPDINGNYFFSFQESRGVSTANFQNFFGHPGTVGSILETPITIPGGQTFSFNWAFITSDGPHSAPPHPPAGYDFALFYLRTPGPTTIVYTEGLAQVVPIPPTLILMGSGLLGIAGIGLRRKKVL